MQSTERFSSRVGHYLKFRPGYPAALVDCLRTEHGLGNSCVVADLGSGTGIWTEMLLKNGNEVFAVEPNGPMREAAEHWLARDPRFHSVVGMAEATSLPDSSVDWITAAQSFHWFDPHSCRPEFRRILRAGGSLALIWNERLTDATPFLRDYEALLVEFATDYPKVDHRRIGPAALARMFGEPFQTRSFPNAQRFDFEGLEGRLLSSSYAPEAGHPRHGEMLRALRRIFDRHQTGGEIRFEYETKLHVGPLG